MKLTTKQKNDFIQSGVGFINMLLISAYKAFEKKALENGKENPLAPDDEVLGIMRHVACISIALEPLQKTFVKLNPDFKDIYAWMDSIAKQYEEIITALQKKEDDAAQSSH